MNDDVKAVLREFNGNRVVLAAAVVRLRRELEDALYECSRLRATGSRLVEVPEAERPARRPGLR